MKWYQKINEKVLCGISVALSMLAIAFFFVEQFLLGYLSLISAVILVIITVYIEYQKKKDKKESENNPPPQEALSNERLETEGKQAAALVPNSEIDIRINAIDKRLNEIEGTENLSLEKNEKRIIIAEQLRLIVEKRELVLRKMEIIRENDAKQKAEFARLEAEGKQAAALVSDGEVDGRIAVIDNRLSELENLIDSTLIDNEKKQIYSEQYRLTIEKRELLLRKIQLPQIESKKPDKPPRGSLVISIGVGNTPIGRETISLSEVDKTIETITVIDFETACHAYNSACSIGIAVLQGTEIVDKQYYLIQPPNNFYTNDNIAVHHITPDDTKDADTFPAIWEKIKHLFEHSCVAAHNANFDMSVLKATLNHYGIEQPDFLYVDTIAVSGFAIPSGAGIRKSLDARCEYFGIPLENHHNALSDAVAAAQLILHSMAGSRYETAASFIRSNNQLIYAYSDVRLKATYSFGFNNVNVHEIAAATTINEEKDADFDGKTFVITGEFKTISREQALSIIVSRGGIIKSGVSSKVDFLVNADNRTSTKTQKAEALQAQGHRIRIINEKQFMRMLEDNHAIDLDED